jgi:hypothetical protein
MRKTDNKPAFLALTTDSASEDAVLQAQHAFLRYLWLEPKNSSARTFGNLCFRPKGSTRMLDQFIPLDADLDIKRLLKRYDRDRYDQYFSPNLYAQRQRKMANVRRTRLGWCDVDDADPFAFAPTPSFVWQTSPGRTQALWLWDQHYSPERAAAYSKALTYRHGGDKGGSASNKLLRLPGSFNHKPGYAKPFIPLLWFDPRPITARPHLLTERDGSQAVGHIALHTNPQAHDRLKVWKKYRNKLNVFASCLLRHNQILVSDRSKQVFTMVVGLHEAGATTDEIASVLWTSPYFHEKNGNDRDALETEISRIVAKAGDKK